MPYDTRHAPHDASRRRPPPGRRAKRFTALDRRAWGFEWAAIFDAGSLRRHARYAVASTTSMAYRRHLSRNKFRHAVASTVIHRSRLFLKAISSRRFEFCDCCDIIFAFALDFILIELVMFQ
jgi:hypothetical protein